MDVILIIFVIILAAFFIVRAINRNTVSRALIAEQQYLSSPEYLKQRQASMDYFDYLMTTLDYQIWTATAKNGGDKARVKELQQDLKEVDERYQEARKQYIGYQPEALEIIRDKYELAIPFSPSDDGQFINEDLASSWSMYIDKKEELSRLTALRTNVAKAKQHHKDD